ncbi:RimK family alpha-L-glutamate ligase [Rummeliibacillus pycnus]|uniref:RimK family alpha-L-glutamate ligase n=1 Tax=Rummeliibacillus pycnus TaxID=101070 RepID=UPI0037C556AC
MMKHAYLLYEQQDAEKNGIFIEQVIEAAKKHDIELSLVITDGIDLNFLDTTFGEPLFVWNRTRNAQIAKKLELIGIKVFNSSFVNALANDKKNTLQFAQLQGIPTVPILLDHQIQQYPVIIKTIDGHGGNEVALCKNVDELTDLQEKWHNRKTIIQPYIESNATDVRVWVLGSEIIGTVKRIGGQDFRSNYTLGGTIEKYELDAEKREQVKRLQKALKSDYIGIDFLLLPSGDWILNEIEDPVGARSYYELYDEFLPSLIIEYFNQQKERA